MRDVFRRHLRPCPNAEYEIEEVRLTRLHYHHADRCALQYTLRLREGRTGCERTQWVTGLIYAGERAARTWHKLAATDPRRAHPDAFPTFAPLAFIPDLDMVAQVFPYDRHLPALSRLTSGPGSALAAVLRRACGPGDWDIEGCRIEPVHYRVGRAAVVRYEVAARTTPTRRAPKRFYAKVYREEAQGARTYDVLRRLSERATSGDGGVGVAPPVAYLRDLRTLVQEEVRGTSLQQLLVEGREGSAVRQAARAMATFSSATVVGLRHHRLHSEVATLKTAAESVEWACPHLRAQVEALVSAIVACLDEVSPQLTHRELRTDHIFLNSELLTLIDLDSCAGSDPVLDPARVLADLAGLSLRLDMSRDDRWKAAAHDFVEEYFRHVPRTWRARLFPHYAGALLKEAVDFVRHCEPQWPEKVAMLIEQAEHALSRRSW